MKLSSFQPTAFGQELNADGTIIEGLDVRIPYKCQVSVTNDVRVATGGPHSKAERRERAKF